VIATNLFAAAYPEWFGHLGRSLYTLFQIMTLESWSMGIVRPVMEQHPQAWLFFVPFVIVTSFAVLNLFIALIVNSMQTVHERDLEQVQVAEGLAHAERQQLMKAVQALHDEVRELRTRLVSENGRKH
jgi:voltage-gated sodium channel